MHMDLQECHLAQCSGAGIFLQAMNEGKVQLAHFILGALGDAPENALLESKGAAGQTLLMCASMLPRTNERTCFMQLLLGRGVDVERQDEAGRTALSLASEQGYLDAIRLLLLYGAHPGTPDNEGRSPLDYAIKGHHEDVARFLLNELQRRCENRKIEAQTRAGGQQNGSRSNRSVSGGFFQGANHSLCRRTRSDVLLFDQVIYNPYALDKEEEKHLSQYNYQKHSNSIPDLHPQICEQITESSNFHNPRQKPSSFLKMPQTQLISKVNFKYGFLPTWMKRSSTCLSNLSTERTINKPPGIFSKRMASKMPLRVSSSLRESQTNLLIPEGDVMDSTLSTASHHLSEQKLQITLTDTVLQNCCVLQESSQWVETTEGFLKDCYERCGKEKLYPDHIKMNRLPKEKHLSRIHNAVQLLSQSEQNNAPTRSGNNVFRALRRRTNPELRFFHTGKLDPEQEALVREEQTNSCD